MINCNQKLIFLDIDGTIYSRLGKIPDSTRLAIQKARENGHKIFLSTGRNKAEVSKDIWNLGFDGLVASAGAYVELDGNLIYNQHLEFDSLTILYDYLLKNDIKFVIETNDRIYGLEEHISLQKKLFEHLIKMNIEKEKVQKEKVQKEKVQKEKVQKEKVQKEKVQKEKVQKETPYTPDPLVEDDSGINVFSKLLTVTEDVYQVKDANKILFFNSYIPVKQIQTDLESLFSVIYGTVDFLKGESGEIFGKSINKATGIEKIMKQINAKREDIIAIGDGENDLEMIAFAGTGIAMGNAVENLKNIADYITSEVTKDGLYQGFLYCGLI